MGPGGPRGLQILLPGANPVRGGFDSHASPPALALRGRVWALVGLALTLVLLAGTAGAQPLGEKGPSPGGAALRSLLLPGWGQAANGSWLKAAGFAGAYSGLVIWGISLNQEKQDAVGRLGSALDADDQRFWELEVERLEDARNAKFWLAGLTLLLSMADALVDAHLKGFDERIDAEVGMIPLGDEPAVGLRVSAPLTLHPERAR